MSNVAESLSAAGPGQLLCHWVKMETINQELFHASVSAALNR